MYVFVLIWTIGIVIQSSVGESEFCHRGFQLASRYHDCWQQAGYANKYPPLYEQNEIVDGPFVEAYAKHMCSVVKPAALKCFKKTVAGCTNANKLIHIADESGGACERNHLNPYFKQHVLDKLVPVRGDSPCFNIGDSSYECYAAAGERVIDSGVNTVDIVRFHYVADKFFNVYWNCLIQIYKANEPVCPNWQIPMLLVLQKTALPSLFGMKLTAEQVHKLELSNENETSEESSVECSTDAPEKIYLMMKVLTSKAEMGDDELMLEIDTSDVAKPQIAVVGNQFTSSPSKNRDDLTKFIKLLSGDKAELTLKALRKMMRQHRRKNKEVNNFVNQIKQGEKRLKKGKNKKPGRQNGSKKGTNKKDKARMTEQSGELKTPMEAVKSPN